MRDESPASQSGDYLKAVKPLNVSLSLHQDKGTFFLFRLDLNQEYKLSYADFQALSSLSQKDFLYLKSININFKFRVL